MDGRCFPDHGRVYSAGSSSEDVIVVTPSQDARCIHIHAEEHSVAHVFVTCDAALDMGIMIQAAPHAQLRVTVLCTDATGSLRIVQCAELEEGANLSMHLFTLGIADCTHIVRSTLKGAHAVSDIDWTFYAAGSDKVRFSARNQCDGRIGGGEITMRGVAEETAHARLEGMIGIGPMGGGTDTYLTQEVLMLDSTAKVDAIPGLEIKTNDVKASHSATVARVQPEDLLYFGARGIPPAEARRMFVMGFLGDATDAIPDVAVRERVIAAIEKAYEKD